jgi:propionyl-CoA carboxylase alpha chain
MFKKILIANRGEIACRVIKTARKMGIATVAVYSEADRDARHVELADEAVLHRARRRRASPIWSWTSIIAACKDRRRGGASGLRLPVRERGRSRARVEEAGIVFIGPKHARSRRWATRSPRRSWPRSGVNTIPGYNEAIDTPEQAVEIAQDIGYPVMIKASAGGGGKGLRVAYNDKEAFEGFTSCRNEARNSFGDDRVFIEKFVEEPRHIEIQVLGDAHGNWSTCTSASARSSAATRR